MIPDKFFLWPYEDSLAPAIDELTPMLLKSGLAPYVSGPWGNLAEFIALVCREWNINPWWLVVSGQREQGIFSKQSAPAAALQAWLGFVGQDIGRSSLPGYYGVFTQAQRCIAQSAWLLNVKQGVRPRSVPRYRPGISLQIEKDGAQVSYTPAGPGEYLQLTYTPHFKVLQTNFEIAQQWVPSKYIL